MPNAAPPPARADVVRRSPISISQSHAAQAQHTQLWPSVCSNRRCSNQIVGMCHFLEVFSSFRVRFLHPGEDPSVVCAGQAHRFARLSQRGTTNLLNTSRFCQIRAREMHGKAPHARTHPTPTEASSYARRVSCIPNDVPHPREFSTPTLDRRRAKTQNRGKRAGPCKLRVC